MDIVSNEPIVLICDVTFVDDKLVEVAIRVVDTNTGRVDDTNSSGTVDEGNGGGDGGHVTVAKDHKKTSYYCYKIPYQLT